MFELAHTAWPRFGGDQANRSRIHIPGPHSAPRWQKIALTTPSTENSKKGGGVVVMPDETLRVCHGGAKLSAVTLDGTILWQMDLSRLMPRKKNVRWQSSCPTALQTGDILVYVSDILFVVKAPKQVQPIKCAFYPMSDGTSPNFTYSGYPIISAVTGEVALFKDKKWQNVGGRYGFDIECPAVYDDNSLAIAGYAGGGFRRVDLDGVTRWKTSLEDADLLPTINRQQVAAVGSLNERISMFFSPEGEKLGEYGHPAKFAEYIDGGWIALSKQRLARLTLAGEEIWHQDVDCLKDFSFVEQAIVDCDGFIYTRQKSGFFCYDADGRKVFEANVPSASGEGPDGLASIVAPGVMVYVSGNELFIGHA